MGPKDRENIWEKYWMQTSTLKAQPTSCTADRNSNSLRTRVRQGWGICAPPSHTNTPDIVELPSFPASLANVQGWWGGVVQQHLESHRFSLHKTDTQTYGPCQAQKWALSDQDSTSILPCPWIIIGKRRYMHPVFLLAGGFWRTLELPGRKQLGSSWHRELWIRVGLQHR